MTLVKVCGVRSLVDATAALDAGADMLGFNFWRPGKRYISPASAAAIIGALRSKAEFKAVGVFVDPTRAEMEEALDTCELDLVQLSGRESPEDVALIPRPVLKAIHVRPGEEHIAAQAVATNAYGAERYLLDTHGALPGGNGIVFEWDALRDIGQHCIVAGGLRPDNVRLAIETLKPIGVDVASGVEGAEGAKDPDLIRAFLEAVRSYDNNHAG